MALRIAGSRPLLGAEADDIDIVATLHKLDRCNR